MSRSGILVWRESQRTPSALSMPRTMTLATMASCGTVWRRYALKPVLAFGLEQPLVAGNRVKPSHVVRRGRPLPTALSREDVQRLLAQIDHPLERALLLVMRWCGLRVAEVVELKRAHIAWEQQARRIAQGKGRQDRRVSMSPAPVASLQACLAQHPGERAKGDVLWHRKRHQQPLSVQATDCVKIPFF